MIKLLFLLFFLISTIGIVNAQNKVSVNADLVVNGSITIPITFLTGPLTLNNTHHTIVYKTAVINSTITLPPASSFKGRIYTIINYTFNTINISQYRSGATNGTNNSIPSNTIYQLVSDGEEWLKCN